MSDTHNSPNLFQTQADGQTAPLVWVVTEGIAGTENQCIAVAQALNLSPIIKRVQLRQPWKLLSPYIGFENRMTFTGDSLNEPWPDIVLAGGRKAIAACRYIKRQSRNKTKIIFFQNPRISTSEFDLVVAPHHDGLSGANVIVSKATPTKFNVSMIEKIKSETQSPFPQGHGLSIAVIIGGGIAGRDMPLTEQKIILDLCQKFASDINNKIMIIGSRRTPHNLVSSIRSITQHHNHIVTWFPDDQKDNPYTSAIAHADIVMVTADSPSMISDAASAGRSTYVIGDAQTKRHAALISSLNAEGHIRIFDGDISIYPHKLLDDVGYIAHEIQRKIQI